jgi:hypothetical protein
MIFRIQSGLTGLALVASVSCGGGTSQTTPGTPAVTQPAAAGQPSPQAGAARKPQAKPVDVELLKSFLPELDGWTRTRPRGEQMTTPYVISNARTHYASGASSLDIEITDSALNQMIFAPFAAFMTAGYEERTADGYKKAVVVAGAPGFESWEKGAGHGEVTVIVASRFVVHASGRRVPGIEAVRKAVTAIDLKRLATLR